MYICICIVRERERERQRELCVYIYIYTHTYIFIHMMVPEGSPCPNESAASRPGTSCDHSITSAGRVSALMILAG